MSDLIQFKLEQMLGNHAYNNDMKVDPDFAKLAKVVDYLVAQIRIMGNDVNDDQLKNHSEAVLENVKSVLK
jgi:hypothetical protein